MLDDKTFDSQSLEVKLESLAAADQFSGTVLIVRGDSVEFKAAYGYASRRWSVPCTLDTRFDCASITKLFTAVATMQQIEAGAFTLNTGVCDYLELTDTTISADVTVYQLLTHTSGIGDDADEEDGQRYEDLWIEKPNYSVTEAVDVLPHFTQKPAKFSPGKGCRYCNCAYVLLGLMIERATNQNYRDYIQSRIFEPANMTDAGFFHRNLLVPNVAEGLDPIMSSDGEIQGWKSNLYSYPPVGLPDGGAHVSANDLISFHRALLEGVLLNTTMTESMLVSREFYKTASPDISRMMGFGFEFEVRSDGTTYSYSKDGINVGASGILRHYPDSNRTVVVLSNMEEGVWQPIDLIDNLIQLATTPATGSGSATGI